MVLNFLSFTSLSTARTRLAKSLQPTGSWAYCLLFRLEAVSEGNLDGIYVTHRVRAGIYSIQWAKEFVAWFNSGAWTTFPFEPLLPVL